MLKICKLSPLVREIKYRKLFSVVIFYSRKNGNRYCCVLYIIQNTTAGVTQDPEVYQHCRRYLLMLSMGQYPALLRRNLFYKCQYGGIKLVTQSRYRQKHSIPRDRNLLSTWLKLSVKDEFPSYENQLRYARHFIIYISVWIHLEKKLDTVLMEHVKSKWRRKT